MTRVAGDDRSEVLFAEINPSNLIPGGPVNRFCVVLSTTHKTAGTLSEAQSELPRADVKPEYVLETPIARERVFASSG